MFDDVLTRTDPAAASEARLEDEVVRLREWGSDRTYELPRASAGEWTVGSAPGCTLRLTDPGRFVSRLHARLVREADRWVLMDAGSKNGLWQDGARRRAFPLRPGLEIGIGRLRLIAESPRLVAVRELLARIIGWQPAYRVDVDRALRSLRELATLRAPLRLHGEGDLVAVVRGLHRRLLGADRPFVTSDPRRVRSTHRPTPRAAPNDPDALAALRAAAGGTLCVWADRLPPGFAEVRARLDQPGIRVRLVVCSAAAIDVAHGGPPPIVVTPLAERAAELDRIIDEYAADALVALGARHDSYAPDDRSWTRHRRPRSLAEIETTVTRLIAIRDSGGISRAAARLGISHVALSRWLGRREGRLRSPR